MKKASSILVLTLLATATLQCASQGKTTRDQSRSAAETDTSSKTPSETAQTSEETDVPTDELPYRATGPVALVDGSEISAETYNRAVLERHGTSRTAVPRETAERMVTDTLDAVIKTHIIERELRKHDIEVTDEEVEAKFQRFSDRFPDAEAFASYLERRNTSKTELKERMRKKLRLHALLRQQHDIEVSDRKAKKYYENHVGEFTREEQVRVRHILIEIEAGADERQVEQARQTAREVVEEARKKDADFAELAEKYSDDPSGKRGGALGWIPRDRQSEFADTAFSLNNGEVSDPLETDTGFQIIERVDHREADKESFDEVRSDIVYKLEQRRLRKVGEDVIAKLRKKAAIERKRENIEIDESAISEGGIGAGVDDD